MPASKTLTDEQFREAFKAGETPAETQIRKGFLSEVKAADGDGRTIDFVISTDAVDRMGDTIAVDGWKLDNYKRNPVVLWAHDCDDMPVGKASNIRVEGGKLKATAEFMPADMNPFADMVYKAILGGYLNATSVGFAPLKYAFSEEQGRQWGIDFLEQELLEFSVVPVPANQEALVEGRAASKSMAPGSPLRAWVDATFKAAGLSTLPTKQLESMMALPERFRAMANSLPDKAKGARGQIIRCANFAEKQIAAGAEEPIVDLTDPEPDEPEQKNKTTPRLDMARRRLEMARRRST